MTRCRIASCPLAHVIVFTHHTHTSCLHTTLTHHVHTSHSHTMFTHHTHTPCSHITLTSCSHITLTHHVHTSHSHTMFTRHTHTPCSHVTLTHHGHTSHSHTMFTHHTHTLTHSHTHVVRTFLTALATLTVSCVPCPHQAELLRRNVYLPVLSQSPPSPLPHSLPPFPHSPPLHPPTSLPPWQPSRETPLSYKEQLITLSTLITPWPLPPSSSAHSGHGRTSPLYAPLSPSWSWYPW